MARLRRQQALPDAQFAAVVQPVKESPVSQNCDIQ